MFIRSLFIFYYSVFSSSSTYTVVLNWSSKMCDTKSRLDGKVAIVTGGSSGMGLEAARKLASLGANVIIASRNETKLRNARIDIQKSTGNLNVAYKVLDLASLKSVRNFASEVNLESRVDVLVNNAGAYGLPDILTEDGLSLTMQVNFFGAFLLTYLLLPMLIKSAPSRIINQSAGSMYIGHIDFDHWNDIGRYSDLSLSGNSKLAVALITAELSKRLKGTGVTANSFNPFLVRDTDILRNVSGFFKDLSSFLIEVLGQSKEDVAKQIAVLAASPKFKDVSGEHYQFCGPWLNHWLVHDIELTKKLWDVSKKLVGITDAEDWEKNTNNNFKTMNAPGLFTNILSSDIY